jgi:hypothetical protein
MDSYKIKYIEGEAEVIVSLSLYLANLMKRKSELYAEYVSSLSINSSSNDSEELCFRSVYKNAEYADICTKISVYTSITNLNTHNYGECVIY